MRCYCCVKYGGAGRKNTPYTEHLYRCEFYLDDIDYSYDTFIKEYEYLEKNNYNSEYIYNYFWKKHSKLDDIEDLIFNFDNLVL